MKPTVRSSWMLLIVLGLGCHRGEQASKSDPVFDQKWMELANSGTEPLFIEGNLHGSGLMGEVRRAADRSEGHLAGKVETVQGPLPDDQVVRVIRQNLGGVKGCFEAEERAGTIGSGKAIVSLEIMAAGTVGQVKVDAPAFSASQFSQCVTARARAWTFPKFTQAPKRFSYPFVFVGG